MFFRCEKLFKIHGGQTTFLTPVDPPLSNPYGYWAQKWVCCRTPNPQRRVVTKMQTFIFISSIKIFQLVIH